MAQINIKLATGEVFTISNSFCGASGPLGGRKDAEVQMSLILSKLAAISTDQGYTVNVSQIVYEWVTD